MSYFNDDILFENLKKVTLQFSMNRVETNKAYFFEKSTDIHDLPLHISTTPYSSHRLQKENNLFIATVNASKFTSTYFRYCKKLPEILANLGGILSIIMTIFKLVNTYVAEYLFNLKLMDALFEFDKAYFDQNVAKNFNLIVKKKLLFILNQTLNLIKWIFHPQELILKTNNRRRNSNPN